MLLGAKLGGYMRTKMLLSQKKVSKLTRRIKALADDEASTQKLQLEQ